MIGQKHRLIPTVSRAIRRRGFSYSTEKNYTHWIKRFVRFHGLLHPEKMEPQHIEEFLTHLATDLKVSSSTQNQALNALVFLFREVLQRQDEDFRNFVRAKPVKLLPVVLSRGEVLKILENLDGLYLLMTGLLYGCGVRLNELLNLRVKDVDLVRNQLWVRQGKGKKDRVLPFPSSLRSRMNDQLERVEALHHEDTAAGFGSVYLPEALARKYPQAAYQIEWKYVFPSSKVSQDPRSGITRRHHRHQSMLIRHIRKAADKAKVHKKLTTHCFRHSYATHLLEKGESIRMVQELLGHSDLKTTMIYTHVASTGLKSTQNPLDQALAEKRRDQEEYEMSDLREELENFEMKAPATRVNRGRKHDRPNSRADQSLLRKLFVLLQKLVSSTLVKIRLK